MRMPEVDFTRVSATLRRHGFSDPCADDSSLSLASYSQNDVSIDSGYEVRAIRREGDLRLPYHGNRFKRRRRDKMQALFAEKCVKNS